MPIKMAPRLTGPRILAASSIFALAGYSAYAYKTPIWAYKDTFAKAPSKPSQQLTSLASLIVPPCS